jgi:tetratricopeptide (TPR) repeat protein
MTHAEESEIQNQAPSTPNTSAGTVDEFKANGSVALGTEFDFLEQQIFRGEAANAQNTLETTIAQISALKHRYHEDLLVPLALLGDALMVQGQVDAAIDRYVRARHIARVSYGLFSQRQLPLVYREADAYRRIEDFQSSAKREEYAYDVSRKALGDSNPDLIPATMRLANFYLETFNYFSAREMFNRAMIIRDQNGLQFEPAAIPALKGIAITHRLEKFPLFYVSSRNANPDNAPISQTSTLDRQQVTFNNFPAGEKALQRIVEIRRRQDPQDPLATRNAIIELADWHLMFGRTSPAHTLYTYVYEQMLALDEDPALFFAEPYLLYMPKPEDPQPKNDQTPDQAATGYIELGFDVATNGRIRALTTLTSYPPKLMDFKVRRSLRMAIYRPSLVAGLPVKAENRTYTHEFKFYPQSPPTQTAAPSTPVDEITEVQE